MTAFKRPAAGALLAAAAIIPATFGPGLAPATADPTEEQLIEISRRSIPETCQAIQFLPSAQGVRGAIADVMSQNLLPKHAAGRVVGHAVRLSCPEYLPLVQQVLPDFP